MFLKGKKKFWAIILFSAPGLIIYFVLVLIPVIKGFALSTYRWTSLTKKFFVGFDNYAVVLSDAVFQKSFINSLIFMVASSVSQLILGFILGYLLYLQVRKYKIYKTIFFIPAVLSTTAVGFIGNYILSPAFGLVKPAMKALGLSQYYSAPLANASLALMFIVIAQLWAHLGVQIMMFNSAFMSNSQEVIEMSLIDGATGIKQIRYMVIPLAMEVIKVIVVLQVIGSLKAFDLIFVMTRGGPNHATEVLPMNMFLTAFESFKFGEGSVVGVIIFLLSIGITIGLKKVLKTDNN